MNLVDRLTSELIDIIEWPSPAPGDIAWRFTRLSNEIKNGAQLVVRPGQVAIFVDQGKVADIFPPGRHELLTDNLPVLSTLRGWAYGFSSPFKAEVLFVRTTQLPVQKWGTKTPVIVKDPLLGIVRVRAYGTFAVEVANPHVLLAAVVGASEHVTTAALSDRFRDLITARVNSVLGAGTFPVVEMAAQTPLMRRTVADAMPADLAALGFRLVQFTIERVSVPDDVATAMDRQSAVAVAGGVAGYTQLAAADAMRDAAKNPGGGAGAAMAMGAGVALGQIVGQSVAAISSPAVASAGSVVAPPPLPGVRSIGVWHVAALGGASNPAVVMSMDAVKAGIANGVIVASTMVWTAGMASWESVGSTAQFAGLFVPPPLPAA